MVTIQDELAVARAFGLGGEFANSKFVDSFGSLVYTTGEQWGFVTRTRYRDTCHQEVDRTLLLVPSAVAVHDGAGEPVFERKWAYFHRWFDDRTFCRKDFRISGATFAAVERQEVPERVFLFFDSSGFSLPNIIERLEVWRQKHPPKYLPASLPRKEVPGFLRIKDGRGNA